MLEQAKIFAKSMNLDKALFLLEKAEPMNPDNIEISLLKAKVLILKKDT
jgi:lipopolysaccharide biosynthesis regulator YciM